VIPGDPLGHPDLLAPGAEVAELELVHQAPHQEESQPSLPDLREIPAGVSQGRGIVFRDGGEIEGKPLVVDHDPKPPGDDLEGDREGGPLLLVEGVGDHVDVGLLVGQGDLAPFPFPEPHDLRQSLQETPGGPQKLQSVRDLKPHRVPEPHRPTSPLARAPLPSDRGKAGPRRSPAPMLS
jgi:hypothetical protein